MAGNKIALRKEQVELIEQLAHVHESMGLQPAMAKIMGLLTVSDDTELTFDQLMETLNLSKSAISQALNQLLLTKRVSYKTRIGDRKRYFYATVADWESLIAEQFSSIAALVNINKKVLAIRPAKTKEFNKSLGEMTEFLSFLQSQAPLLYKQYRSKK